MQDHPGPPKSLCKNLVIRKVAGVWYRSFDSKYGAAGPLYFGHSDFRFNSPDGSFAVLYASMTVRGMFMETFGRKHRKWDTQKFMESKSVAELKSEDLSLIDITGRGLLAIGADARLATGRYKMTQKWAAWLHSHPITDGILYRSRHDSDCECAAIFDRAASKLQTRAIHDLATKDGKLFLVDTLRYYKFKIRKSPRR